ncbi:transposase [Cupriavidus necator]
MHFDLTEADMKYCGIDLHSNNSVVVVSDVEDRIVLQRRLPNDLEQILSALAAHQDELVGVVVESTYNWYWLVDGLMDAGYQVHLAQLLRLGLLPEGYIYPREQRAARDLARKRIQLVRCRTAQILAIENLFARHTGKSMSSRTVKRMTTEQVDAIGLPADVALAVKANLAISDALQQQIAILEKRLTECVKLRAEYLLLKTVPGIGETLATTIMLETGTPTRFAEVGKFSSYCRCVDSARQSNGKKKGEGNTRNGNAYLAWAFVEAANFTLRQCLPARRFYERKLRATNRFVALKAVAHKLARACYYMLREQQPFDVNRCFV